MDSTLITIADMRQSRERHLRYVKRSQRCRRKHRKAGRIPANDSGNV